jgi:phosphatidylserine/phosphatidylglycerophosphate/cardiolipin synthase-like enzyme
MLNPDSAFSSGSYSDVRQRILRRLRSAGVTDKVLGVFQNAYEEALAVENLVLSRVERKRLLQDVLRSELAELGKRLDEGRISD